MAEDACAVPRRGLKGPLAVFFVCAHCSLTLLTGALALGLAALPPVFGVPLVHVLVPALILGGLALWLASGRRGATRS